MKSLEMPVDPVSPLPDLLIDELASQPINIDHFSARSGSSCVAPNGRCMVMKAGNIATAGNLKRL